MKKAQPDPVANRKIKVELGVVAGLKKTFTNVRQDHITISKKRIHLLCGGHARHMRQERRRRAPINHLEWLSLKCRMVGGVVALLRP